MARGSIYILCILMLMLAASCSNTMKDDPLLVKAPEEKKVEKLYAPFQEGNYEEFVDNMLSVREKSAGYREQMVHMMKQHAAKEIELHQGLNSMKVLRVEQSPQNRLYAEAYLQMYYADGTTEQVCIPLIYQDGRWWLK